MKYSLMWRLTMCAALACGLAMSGPICLAQTAPGSATKTLSPAAEQALIAADRSAAAELQQLDRAWHGVFREARRDARLRGFVGETLGFFEKLQQVQERAFNPAATADRVKGLFRARVLDEDTVCQLMEKSLREFCQKLDEQDQAMLIRLRIDRAATRTTLSRSVIDPATFKKPIHAAATAAVEAVENDLSRSVASFVASQAIGMAAKRGARDLGILPGEEGSFADFLGGLLIEIGVDAAVDAVSDPTDGMVSHLDMQLQQAEHAILEGTPTSPGLLTTLRRVSKERSDARRKILLLELSN